MADGNKNDCSPVDADQCVWADDDWAEQIDTVVNDVAYMHFAVAAVPACVVSFVVQLFVVAVPLLVLWLFVIQPNVVFHALSSHALVPFPFLVNALFQFQPNVHVLFVDFASPLAVDGTKFGVNVRLVAADIGAADIGAAVAVVGVGVFAAYI